MQPSLRRKREIALALFVGVASAACPPADKKDRPPAPSEACARFGQTCEVSPGKLGTCVLRDGCTEQQPGCFVCQSQH